MANVLYSSADVRVQNIARVIPEQLLKARELLLCENGYLPLVLGKLEQMFWHAFRVRFASTESVILCAFLRT
jgi:hypothetical protein